MREIKFRGVHQEKEVFSDNYFNNLEGSEKIYYSPLDGLKWFFTLLSSEEFHQGIDINTGKYYEENKEDIYLNDYVSCKFKDKKEVTEIKGLIIEDENMYCVQTDEGEIYSINRLYSFLKIMEERENQNV